MGTGRWFPRLLGVGALVAVAAGCVIHLGKGVGPDLEHPSPPGRVLLVGYLDMQDAQGRFNFVQLRHVAPNDDKPYYQMRLDRGVFYSEMTPPGPYALYQFGQWQELHYHAPRQVSPVRVIADQPDGIYFMGAYRFVPVRRAGTFQRGEYDLEPIDHPDEAEALAVVLAHAGGTVWEPRIRARLEALR